MNPTGPGGARDARARSALSWLNVVYALMAAFGLYSSLNLATGLFGADPDVVHSLLMWKGITQHGLGWVRDWRFTPDNWLLSSVPLHAIAYSLFGASPNLPIFMGWATFVAAAAASAAIAARLGARKALAPIVVVLLNLGPLAHRAGFVSYATSHNTTNLFGLLAVLCMLAWLGRRQLAFLLAAALLMICGTLSDPWMVASFDLPLGLAALALAIPFKAKRGELLAALAAVVLSLVVYATQLFGLLGFVPKLHFLPAPWGLAMGNAIGAARDAGALLDVIPPVGPHPGVLYLLSFFAFLALTAALAWTGRRSWLRGDPDKAFVYAVAALSAGGAGAALTIMNAPVTEISTRFLINIPYLLAPVLGVLAEGSWSAMGRARKAAVIALPSAMVITGMVGGAAELSPKGIAIRDLGAEAQAAFLRANGLSYGYGPYWGSNANVIALVTKDAIRVRPVTFSPGRGFMQTGIRPQASRQWYRPSDEPPGLKQWFVIVHASLEECPDLGLCVAGLRRQFGEPVRILDHGLDKVLVWDHRLIGGPSARIRLSPGRRLTFGEGGALVGAEGWEAPEPWGVWSEGEAAIVRLQLDGPAKGDLTLEVQSGAFLTRDGRQAVRVSLNDRPLGVLRFDSKTNEGARALRIPAGTIPADGRMDLAFEIEQPTAPSEIGVSSDPRKLGLGLEALTLR